MRNAPSAKGGARVPRRSDVVGLYVVPRLEEVAVDPTKTGVLDAGSGAYVRALQGPHGAGFSLLFAGTGGPISQAIAPELTIIRIR